MTKRICIYVLAVLFLGSVAHVNATSMKSFKKHGKKSNWFQSKKSNWYQPKFEKFNSKSLTKKNNRRASFLKHIAKFEPKHMKPKEKHLYKELISKKFKKITYYKSGLRDYKSGQRCDQNPVPEPSTMLLLGCGLIGLAGWGRKKLKKE